MIVFWCCLAAALILAGSYLLIRKLFPKGQKLARHSERHIPADIKHWEASGRHHHTETREFSAIPPGANKHYADETAQMAAIPPVPRAR